MDYPTSTKTGTAEEYGIIGLNRAMVSGLLGCSF